MNPVSAALILTALTAAPAAAQQGPVVKVTVRKASIGSPPRVVVRKGVPKRKSRPKTTAIDKAAPREVSHSTVYRVVRTPATPESAFATYADALYGFTLAYPSDFKPNEGAESVDTLILSGERMTLVAWAEDAMGDSIMDLYRYRMSELGKKGVTPKENTVGRTSYVILWNEGGQRHYERSNYGAGAFSRMRMSWDPEANDRAEPIARAISQRMTAPTRRP